MLVLSLVWPLLWSKCCSLALPCHLLWSSCLGELALQQHLWCCATLVMLWVLHLALQRHLWCWMLGLPCHLVWSWCNRVCLLSAQSHLWWRCDTLWCSLWLPGLVARVAWTTVNTTAGGTLNQSPIMCHMHGPWLCCIPGCQKAPNGGLFCFLWLEWTDGVQVVHTACPRLPSVVLCCCHLG